MRLSRFLLAAGTASMLAACAGNAPAPSTTQAPPPPDLLASWSGGKIEAANWENWKKSAGVGPETPANDVAQQFKEFARTHLEAQAAADAGLTKTKAKADRWESITQRILADLVRREFLAFQYGFSDSAIEKWAAKQDSTVRKMPKDTLRARGGRALALATFKLDSVYTANKESFRKDSTHIKPFDSVKTEVTDLALRAYIEKLNADFAPGLRTRYAVKLTPPVRPEPSEDSLKTAWLDTKERYMNPAVYRLVALASKDSAKLAKSVAKVTDVATFKKLAAKFPVGTPAAPEGVLGRVKSQFALPYGIGMVPELFNVLDTCKAGKVLPVVRANDTLFLVAWMEAKDSATLKPFASVKEMVRADWLRNHPWTPDAKTVLATWDKGALFTQGDVDFISEEVPTQMRRSYPTDRVLDFMLTWKVSARFATEIGIDARPAVKAALADNNRMFFSQEWRQSPQAAMFLYTRAQADSAVAKWHDSLFKSTNTNIYIDSAAGVNRDGARLCVMPKGLLHHTYLVDKDKYRQDSTIQPYDSVRATIYADLRLQLDEMGREHMDSVLKARYAYKTYPAAPLVAPLSFTVAFDSARSAHDRRSLEQAENLYRQVEKDAQGIDSVRAQALFQLGQLFGEQQNYPRSLSAYRSVLVRFPKSNEAYKAQFMIAFTYSEYLKNEKAALVEYSKMLTDYPKSDLTDDADWMIRNIKSGGALMPKFDDSAFVADSAARADSLKKAGAIDATKKGAAPADAPKVKVAPAKADPAKKAAAPADTAKAKATPAKAEAPKKAIAAADTSKTKATPKPTSAPKADSAKAGSKK